MATKNSNSTAKATKATMVRNLTSNASVQDIAQMITEAGGDGGKPRAAGTQKFFEGMTYELVGIGTDAFTGADKKEHKYATAVFADGTVTSIGFWRKSVYRENGDQPHTIVPYAAATDADFVKWAIGKKLQCTHAETAEVTHTWNSDAPGKNGKKGAFVPADKVTKTYIYTFTLA